MTGIWDIFDALTCMHPALADIEDWMLPPYTEGDKMHWPKHEGNDE